MEDVTLSDWIKAMEICVNAERELVRVFELYARGQVSAEELEIARQNVMAMRELTNAVFAKAFSRLGEP